jgi:hypothetical protein
VFRGDGLRLNESERHAEHRNQNTKDNVSHDPVPFAGSAHEVTLSRPASH